MIKILWNQCEVAEHVQGAASVQMAQYGHSGMVTRQCESEGYARKFADGHTSIMCVKHWEKWTCIVDEDGAKHVKGGWES